MNYRNLLSEISNASMASSNIDKIIVPSNKQLYSIDLNSRKVEAPEVLSIQSEHYAETVYFLVDRYYDNMDLAQTNCVIQYVIGKKSYIYAVPFCDTTTYSQDNKMIIPWSISISATENVGTVNFFIRFYLIGPKTDSDDVSNFSYSLCTLPASSKIEKTLSQGDWANAEKDYNVPDEYFTAIDYLNILVDNATVYWEDV